MKDKNRRCASCLSNVKEELSLKNLTLDYDAPVDFVKLQVMNLSNYLVVFKNTWLSQYIDFGLHSNRLYSHFMHIVYNLHLYIWTDTGKVETNIKLI